MCSGGVETTGRHYIAENLKSPPELPNWRAPSSRWTKPVTTRVEPGKDTGGPFVLDTLTLPYENPWNALFYVAGVDFLPDGRVAICTAHGDVWTCKQAGNTL